MWHRRSVGAVGLVSQRSRPSTRSADRQLPARRSDFGGARAPTGSPWPRRPGATTPSSRPERQASPINATAVPVAEVGSVQLEEVIVAGLAYFPTGA